MTYIVKTQGLTKKMKSKILADSLDMHVKQGEIFTGETWQMNYL